MEMEEVVMEAEAETREPALVCLFYSGEHQYRFNHTHTHKTELTIIIIIMTIIIIRTNPNHNTPNCGTSLLRLWSKRPISVLNGTTTLITGDIHN
jgi:hypothetical protein